MASGTTPGVGGGVGGGGGARRSGRCKWFNVVKGYGFITPHDGEQDVFLHQTVIQMQGFRSLAEGEEVEFECRESDKGVEATFVCGPGGTDCKGSERRPVSKKKFRKLRCYNCGDFANHIASKCPRGPLPKRCHNCKSDGHLIADCPLKKADPSGTSAVGSPHPSGGEEPSPTSSQHSGGDTSGDGGGTAAEGSSREGKRTAPSEPGPQS